MRKVAYRLDRPVELSWSHNTFHVSQLRKCLVDDSVVVPLDTIQIDERLCYVERPISSLDRKTKTLHNKMALLVKVQWKHLKAYQRKLETKEEMRENYPNLFAVAYFKV